MTKKTIAPQESIPKKNFAGEDNDQGKESEKERRQRNHPVPSLGKGKKRKISEVSPKTRRTKTDQGEAGAVRFERLGQDESAGSE